MDTDEPSELCNFVRAKAIGAQGLQIASVDRRFGLRNAPRKIDNGTFAWGEIAGQEILLQAGDTFLAHAEYAQERALHAEAKTAGIILADDESSLINEIGVDLHDGCDLHRNAQHRVRHPRRTGEVAHQITGAASRLGELEFKFRRRLLYQQARFPLDFAHPGQ